MAPQPLAWVTVALSWVCVVMSSGTLHKSGNTLQHPGTMWVSKFSGGCVEQSSPFPDDLIMKYHRLLRELPCDIALGVPTVLWSSPRHVQVGSKGDIAAHPFRRNQLLLNKVGHRLTASKVMSVDCRVLSCLAEMSRECGSSSDWTSAKAESSLSAMSLT